MEEKTPLLGQTIHYNSISEDRPRDRLTVSIHRPAYTLEEFNDLTCYRSSKRSCGQVLREKVRKCHPLEFLLKTIPILQWLPNYNWGRDIWSDVVSGITVSIMHIPHGMAYALLGNLPPITGIYMGFFPVLVYVLLGTSRHVSMGTVAITCLMTGKVVTEYASEVLPTGNGIVTSGVPVEPTYTPIQVATTVTFAVAMLQFLMYVFRLGIVTTLLSDTLVNAFTCASAFYVVSEQLQDLLGLTLDKRKGLFRIIWTVYDAAVALPEANPMAIKMSFAFIIFLMVNNEVLKPCLSRKTKYPFPIELVAILTGTAVSYFFSMQQSYNLQIVGNIPTGFPEPDLPSFALLPKIMVDAFSVMMVSYTTSMSLALILAKKRRYEVDADQELLAQGAGNCLGSFFSCMPVTASLSRSMIQESVGGVTQLTSVVSCLLLLTVLLWFGPVFETLPRCVLASIIVVALKGLLVQFTSLKSYWEKSKLDGTVWVVTFLTTVLVAIDVGLVAGMIMSLLVFVIQGYRPYSCILGLVPNLNVYLDAERYHAAVETPRIKIFHYRGALNFALKMKYKSSLFDKIGFDPQSVKRAIEIDCLILDFSAVSNVDPSGGGMLKDLINAFQLVDVEVYIGGCSGPICEVIHKYLPKQSDSFEVFPTLHDAVAYAKETIKRKAVI